MKKKRKLGRKLLSVLLALAMVVGLMPGMRLTAYAADEVSENISLVASASSNLSTISGTHYSVSCGYMVADDKGMRVNSFGALTINARKGETISKVILSYSEGGYRNTLSASIGTFDGNSTITGINAQQVSISSTSTTGVIISAVTVYFEGDLNNPTVTLTGGAYAKSSGGLLTQSYLPGAMDTVTYTALTGATFPEFETYTLNGVTVERTSDTVVTISGTPTANTAIIVPDAVSSSKIVTWNSTTISSISSIITKDYTYTANGITLNKTGKGKIAGNEIKGYDSTASFEFTTATGKFTNIEIAASAIYNGGNWTTVGNTLKWNGTPSNSVSLSGSGLYLEGVSSINFVIEMPTVSVTITPGSNMTKTTDSGAASQTGLSGAMRDVVYTADNGYYFPTNYSVAEVSGIKVTWDSYTQITVSGTPTADVEIELTAPMAKTTPDAPTAAAATDCTTADNNDGKLTGVTAAMEYKKSDAADWTVGTGSDITGLVPGTYYVRVKATETTNASANQELTIAEYTAPIYTVTYKVVNGTWSDDSTTDKTETVQSGLSPASVPTGMKASSGYTGGAWDTNPAEATITGTTTFTYTFTAKQPATVTKVPEKKTLTYNGQSQKLVTDGTTADGTIKYALGNDAETAPADGAFSTTVPSRTNAGTYYVWYKVIGDDNHNDSKPTKIDGVKIAKADPTVTTAPQAKTLTYNGEGQELITAGTSDDGKLVYAVGNDGETAPTIYYNTLPIKTDAGTYYVWYKVIGDDNHNDSKPTKIDGVKISKADATVTVPAVTAVNETVSKKADGKITSVTDAMEYRKDGETTYTAVAEDATEITDLEAGKYYVRYKSDNNHNASDETEVTINAGRKLIATFKNADGTTLQTVEVDYNAVPTFTGDTPTKAKTAQYTYTFKGWNKTITALTDDATYTATYTNTVNQYTVRFVNDDGTVLQSGKVAYGTVPKYTGKTPTKSATAQYTYTFKGWNKTITAVTGAATYTATYDSAKVKYTVTATKPTNGTLTADKTNAAWGETVTVTPKANDGYAIKGVYLNGKQMAVNDKGKYQFEMPKNNVKVTAVFEKKQFTVTATKPTNGTLTADKTNAAWGETVTVTPKANNGYAIKGVYLNGKQMAVNDKGKYQFEMPKNNVKVTAVFEKKQCSIVRVSGDNRFATAAAISKKTFTKADTVVLTYGYNYADALAGVPLASKLNAPILLSNTDSVPSETLAEIKRLGAKKVIILGGTNAISEKAEKQLKAKKLTTQRIVGDTRFSTAVEIAKKINTKPTEVFLVYGYKYADALSVSTVAAIKGAPIVYLPKDGELDADTAAYLKSIKGSVKKAYVIGGKSIISDSVKNKASNALGLKSVQRIAGDDRYLTCLKVNETFKDLFTGSIVCAATGTNFPDALAGGVYAAKNKAPLLLVNTAVDDLSKEQLSWLKAKDAKQVTVFGGTNSVSDKHAEKIAKARV